MRQDINSGYLDTFPPKIGAANVLSGTKTRVGAQGEVVSVKSYDPKTKKAVIQSLEYPGKQYIVKILN